MTLNEMPQRLMNLLCTGLMSAGLLVVPVPAMASIVADFESVTGSFPGTASGPSTTQFNTREWSSSGDGDHAVIMNDAAHAAINDYLQLVPETGSERNTIAFDLTDPGLYQTITVNYDFRITNTTGNPADGLGMSLLSTASHGTSGDGASLAQFGAPADSLNLGLDDYNNGVAAPHFDPSNNHAEVGYDGAASLAVSNIIAFSLYSGDWHHAEATFEYVSGGTAVSLVITPDAYGSPGAPVTVFDKALIAGVLPYEARIAFGAGTGGSDATHDIDNVNAVFDTNGKGFNYVTDFSAANASDFTFNHSGDATPTGLVTSGTTYIHLTDADNDERGSAWYNTKQTVRDGFVTEFTFDFPTTGAGADGMGFVIQNIGTGVNTTETGPGANAFTIEFDSYDNGAAANEPSSAHITLWSGGADVLTYNLASSSLSISDLSGSGPHDVRVEYFNGDLTLYFDDVKVIDGFAVDLAAIGAMDAGGQSWVGFVSRTGGANEEHNVLSWAFVSAVPEPSTFAMLGLAGLGLIRRRRDIA